MLSILKSKSINTVGLICVAIIGSVTNGFSDQCYAQGGVSSMSVGMMRAGILPSPAEIRIEEFINYHRHVIPVPTDGALKLDVKQLRYRDRRYVQLGLAAPHKTDLEHAPPLNLVIVVDCSGSMREGNRMDRVRRGLSMLVERLRTQDLVSIVKFSESAEVCLSACGKSNQTKLQKAIDSLEPTNSTNLHAGLMLGYATALEHFDSSRSNRVILLTDGIANVGQTDAEQIAEESAHYNKKGIDLSTIGVGFDFNQNLLRKLAQAGRGAVHFVDDQQDLSKCFVDEFDSLLLPAARNIKLKIEGCGDDQPNVFGFQPIRKDDGLELKLENMSSGATQVAIFEFDSVDDNPLEIEVQFKNAFSGKTKTLKKKVCWDEELADEDDFDSCESEGDFRKNLAIAFVARGIKKASKECELENETASREILKKALRQAQELFPRYEQDADYCRVAKIAKRFVGAN